MTLRVWLVAVCAMWAVPAVAAEDPPAAATPVWLEAKDPATCQHLTESPTSMGEAALDAVRPLLGRGQTPPWCGRVDFGWGSLLLAERDGHIVLSGPAGAVARPGEPKWRYLTRGLALERLKRFDAPAVELWPTIPVFELGADRAGAIVVPEEMARDRLSAQQGWLLATVAGQGQQPARLWLPGRGKSTGSAAAPIALIRLDNQPLLLTREVLSTFGGAPQAEQREVWDLRHPGDRRRADSGAIRDWFAQRLQTDMGHKRSKAGRAPAGSAAECTQALGDALELAWTARRAGLPPAETRKSVTSLLRKRGLNSCTRCPPANGPGDQGLDSLGAQCPALLKTVHCLETTPESGPIAWTKCSEALKLAP